MGSPVTPGGNIKPPAPAPPQPIERTLEHIRDILKEILVELRNTNAIGRS